MRRVWLAGAVLGAASMMGMAQESAAPQTKAADPSFAVATIKVHDPADVGRGNVVDGHRMTLRNLSLREMVAFANRMHLKQVVGGPAWMDTDGYDVVGIADMESAPNDEQWRRMLKQLLVARFGLEFHLEKQTMGVFVLSVAKGGVKNLTASTSTAPVPGFGMPPGNGGMRMRVVNATMTEFGEMMLQGVMLDRPVVDRTGIKGRWDFEVLFTPDDSMFHGPREAIPTVMGTAPVLYTALEEQVGLKLAREDAPVDVMKVDRVERPSAN